MSKGEVMFTTVAATGLVCLVAAAIGAWVIVTDPASLVPAQGAGAGALLDVAVRMVERVASVMLDLVGW